MRRRWCDCFVSFAVIQVYYILIWLTLFISFAIVNTSITKNSIISLSGYQQQITSCEQLDHVVIYHVTQIRLFLHYKSRKAETFLLPQFNPEFLNNNSQKSWYPPLSQNAVMARGTLLPVYFCSTSLFLSFYGMHRTLHWLALTHTQLEPITKTNTILAYASRFFCTMSKTSIFRWKSKIVSHFETGFSNSQGFFGGNWPSEDWYILSL